MKRKGMRPVPKRHALSGDLGAPAEPRRGARVWRGLWARIVALLVVVIAIAWLRSLVGRGGP